MPNADAAVVRAVAAYMTAKRSQGATFKVLVLGVFARAQRERVGDK